MLTYFVECTEGEDSGAHPVRCKNGVLDHLVDVVPSKADEILPAEASTYKSLKNVTEFYGRAIGSQGEVFRQQRGSRVVINEYLEPEAGHDPCLGHHVSEAVFTGVGWSGKCPHCQHDGDGDGHEERHVPPVPKWNGVEPNETHAQVQHGIKPHFMDEKYMVWRHLFPPCN
jgi:hypothetical protein